MRGRRRNCRARCRCRSGRRAVICNRGRGRCGGCGRRKSRCRAHRFCRGPPGTVLCCGSGPPQGREGHSAPAHPVRRCGGSVGDALLLGPQLGGVVHVPQAAPAAGAGDSTVHRDAVRRRSEQFVQDAEGIPAAVLDDTHLSLIAGAVPGTKTASPSGEWATPLRRWKDARCGG